MHEPPVSYFVSISIVVYSGPTSDNQSAVAGWTKPDSAIFDHTVTSTIFFRMIYGNLSIPIDGSMSLRREQDLALTTDNP